MRIRPGGPDDVDAVLALLDQAVAWLVERGHPEQWGTGPLSQVPQRVEITRTMAGTGALHMAVIGDDVVGAIALGEAPDYVKPADEPELYVELLVTDRTHQGRNIGGRLLDHARSLAREQGLPRLRVDCFAGDGGELVRYYERQGFTRLDPFEVTFKSGKVWPGQVLEDRL